MKPNLFIRWFSPLLIPCIVVAGGPWPVVGNVEKLSGHGTRVACHEVFADQALGLRVLGERDQARPVKTYSQFLENGSVHQGNSVTPPTRSLPSPLDAQTLLDEALSGAAYRDGTRESYDELQAIARVLEEAKLFQAAYDAYGWALHFARHSMTSVPKAPALAGQAHVESSRGKRDLALRLYKHAIGVARQERQGHDNPINEVIVSMIDSGFIPQALGLARQLGFDNEAQGRIAEALIDHGLLNEAAGLLHAMDGSRWSVESAPSRYRVTALLAKAWFERGAFDKGMKLAKRSPDHQTLLPVIHDLRVKGRLKEALLLGNLLSAYSPDVQTEVAIVRALELGMRGGAKESKEFTKSWKKLKDLESTSHLVHLFDFALLYGDVGLACAKASRVKEAKLCFNEAKRAIERQSSTDKNEKLARLARQQAEAGLFNDAENNLPNDSFLGAKAIADVGAVAREIAISGDRTRAETIFARAEAFDSLFNGHDGQVRLAAIEFEAGFIKRGVETISNAAAKSGNLEFHRYSHMVRPLLEMGGITPLLFLVEKSVDRFKEQSSHDYVSLDRRDAAEDDIAKAVQALVTQGLASGDFAPAVAAGRQLLRIRHGHALFASIAIALALRDHVDLRVVVDPQKRPVRQPGRKVKRLRAQGRRVVSAGRRAA